MYMIHPLHSQKFLLEIKQQAYSLQQANFHLPFTIGIKQLSFLLIEHPGSQKQNRIHCLNPESKVGCLIEFVLSK